jgi:hypothetical protein
MEQFCRLLLEGVFVGGYTSLISCLGLNMYTTGFIKHFASYFIGIYTVYCRHGLACGGVYNNFRFPGILMVLTESTLEGLAFLLMATVLTKNYFLIGFILHLVSECVGIHSYFCKNRCVLNQ